MSIGALYFSRFAFVAALFLMSGCSNTGKPARWNEDVQAFAPPVKIKHDPVDIRLIPYDPNRKDPIRDFPKPEYNAVLSGGYWTKTFVGDENSDASFTIDSAEWVIRGGSIATHIYNVVGHVTCNNTDFPILATGGDSSGWAVLPAMADALRAAVVDAATQASAIADNCRQQAPPPDGSVSTSKYDDLRKLGELLDDGIITQKEFDEEKRKILDRE